MEIGPETFKKLLPLTVTVITTIDKDGIPNAAPYSCVMPILIPLNLITIASALPRDYRIIEDSIQGNVEDTRRLISRWCLILI